MHLLLGLISLVWLVLTADNGGGGNGGDGGGGSQGENQRQPQGGGQDWERALANLIQRQGSEGAAATLLFNENRDYRERIRQLEQQMPGQDAVVLTSDQAQAWQTYQGLGAPTDLQQQLEQAQQAQQELAGLRRAEQVRDVAEQAGYRPTVLERLAEGLTLEVREEQVDGQTARVPYVVTGENQAEPLTDYAQQHWADFMPALRAEQGPGQQQLPTQAVGVIYPPQQGGGQPAASNIVGGYFARAYGNGKKE